MTLDRQVRTDDDLYAVLADNVEGKIKPKHVRDLAATLFDRAYARAEKAAFDALQTEVTNLKARVSLLEAGTPSINALTTDTGAVITTHLGDPITIGLPN